MIVALFMLMITAPVFAAIMVEGQEEPGAAASTAQKPEPYATRAELEALPARVTKLEAAIEEIRGQMTAINSKIANLSTTNNPTVDLAPLYSQQKELTAKLTALESKLDVALKEIEKASKPNPSSSPTPNVNPSPIDNQKAAAENPDPDPGTDTKNTVKEEKTLDIMTVLVIIMGTIMAIALIGLIIWLAGKGNMANLVRNLNRDPNRQLAKASISDGFVSLEFAPTKDELALGEKALTATGKSQVSTSCCMKVEHDERITDQQKNQQPSMVINNGPVVFGDGARDFFAPRVGR